MAAWSVGYSTDRTQRLRRRRRKAEELQIGRDLLEQHVYADLYATAALAGGTQERRHLLLHDHLADERRGCEPSDVERHRVAFLHPERRRVDDQIVARRIKAAGRDAQVR